MFLTDGPHGPFYKLHSFRATSPLDGDNLKPVKIAGTLKYEVRNHHNYTGQVTFETEKTFKLSNLQKSLLPQM